MNIKYPLIGLLAAILLVSCSSEKAITLKTGAWIGQLELNDETILPFNVMVSEENGMFQFDIRNAAEVISVENIALLGDSVNFDMPVFESAFKTILRNDSLIGTWTKYGNKKYAVPFVMVPNSTDRFPITSKPLQDYSGKWDLSFSPNNDADRYPAIGDFVQKGNTLAGTIITETGDYRYLEGVVNGAAFQLSTFDGAHAFLFKGLFDADNLMQGEFFSGRTWNEPFQGNRNENAVLRSPETLTYLKEGYDKLAFTFPDLNGDSVSLTDFEGKAVIVQILGSWCPNCMDETKYYIHLKQQFPELQIIGLAYERSADFEEAKKPLLKMVEDLGVNYPVLIAGTWSKKQAAETLPMLNHVMSFPTSVFINPEGEIQRIHTGFYGPSTGVYFEKYTQETEYLIRNMLAK
jgi:thiol-disulfide isomerase/thioredoxin